MGRLFNAVVTFVIHAILLPPPALGLDDDED
jgi:hypothetical protein